jgi:putative ABC transport system substrate-binding protein
MKLNLFKKLISVALIIAMLLTGCAHGAAKTTEPKTTQTQQTKQDETYTIGISQLVEHPALDASKQGFIDEMKNQGINVKFLDQVAQADIANAQMIAEKFVKDDVDLIFTIATLSAQAAKQAIEGTDIPMVFTAVTDPVFSQLVTSLNVTDKNITGVVDAAPIKENLELFIKLSEEIKTIGIIYNIGESNSEVQVEQTKEIADTLGLVVETVGISSVNDIPQAVDTISKKVEGLYIITDNMVASAMSLVAKLAVENGLLTVSADGSHVSDGILVSKGISYYEIGKQSAVIAKEILVNQKDVIDIPVQASENLEKKVNKKTAKALGFSMDNKAFEGAEFIE